MISEDDRLNCVDVEGKRFREIVRAFKEMSKFSVNIYVIRKTKQFDSYGREYWETEKVGDSEISRRYKIVCIDDLGIPFYKKVLFNNKLEKDLRYMGNLDMRFVKFMVDPDMQDHVILGGSIDDYDPTATYKMSRRK